MDQQHSSVRKVARKAGGPRFEANLLKASDLARFFGVRPKTLHNWTEPLRQMKGPKSKREPIPHFRTPGRHLRYHPTDVLAWCRRIGYFVPPPLLEAARAAAPSVVELEPRAPVVAAVEQVA